MSVTAAEVRAVLRAIKSPATPEDFTTLRRTIDFIREALELMLPSQITALGATATAVIFGASDGSLTEDSAGLTFDSSTDKLFVGSLLRVGADDTDHQFDNSSSGSGSTALYYGNRELVRASATPPTFTQTYSTADATLSAYTADDESSAYTGIDNAQGGTPYAQLTDLNALRTAYETLRAFVEDLAGFVNSLVDELQTVNVLA